VQPVRFASTSATSASPLNFDSSTRPFGDCARRSATRSPDAIATPDIAMVFTKSLRFIWSPSWVFREFVAPAEAGALRTSSSASHHTAGDTDVI
jgi:hypothetical protein